jgi:hypothetical protein
MVIIDKFFNLKHFDVHFGCEAIYFKKFGYVSN